MRTLYAVLLLITVSFGDVLVYNGRHLEGARSIAHKTAMEIRWQVNRGLAALRI